MKFSTAFFVVSLVLLSSQNSATQEHTDNSRQPDSLAAVNPHSPEWTTREYSDRFRKQDFAQCSELMDPADLKLLTDVFIRLLKADTTGELMRSVVGPKGGVEAFNSMEPRDRFALVFGTLIGKTRLGSVLSSMENHVLGHVLESDTIAHVVSRVHFSVEDQSLSMCVMTNLRLVQGKWHGMLGDDARLRGD